MKRVKIKTAIQTLENDTANKIYYFISTHQNFKDCNKQLSVEFNLSRDDANTIIINVGCR